MHAAGKLVMDTEVNNLVFFSVGVPVLIFLS